MTRGGATRQLARFVTDLRYGDIPDEVKAKAREIVLHAWGVQLATSAPRLEVGCVNVSAGLAVGEQRLSSGAELITAIVAGYEVVLRAGLAFREFRESHEPHPTGTLGGLAGATVAAKLIGLDETATTHALGFGISNRAGYHEAPRPVGVTSSGCSPGCRVRRACAPHTLPRPA